jgi:hypothetical protein
LAGWVPPGDDGACGPAEEAEAVLIAPNKGRRLQARRVGERKLFDGERRVVFLEWFAGTGNLGWAAKKAGVHYRTVLRHRMEDEAFRSAYDEAEAQSLPRLKAWIVQARAEDEAALAAAGAGAAEGAGEAGAADGEDPEAEEAWAEEAGGDTAPELLSVDQAIRIVEAWEKREAAAARGGLGGGGAVGGAGGPGSAHAARTGRAPSVASNEEVRAALVRALVAHGVRVRGGPARAGSGSGSGSGGSEGERS